MFTCGGILNGCEVEGDVPVFLQGEAEVEMTAALTGLKPGAVCIQNPVFGSGKDVKFGIQRVQLTSHRLLLQSSDMQSALERLPFDLQTAGRSSGHARMSAWFCVRLDRVKGMRVEGSGFIRNRRLSVQYQILFGDAGGGSVSAQVVDVLFWFGAEGLLEPLQEAIHRASTVRAWTRVNPNYDRRVQMGGLSAIQNRQQQKLRAEAQQADQGLSDLQSLRRNAETLLKLAKKVGSSGNTEDNEIRNLLKEYGLLDAAGEEKKEVPAGDAERPPATTSAGNAGTNGSTAEKGRASSNGGTRADCIAEELQMVMEKALQATPAGTMQIHDLYCLFNRLRGTDLVTAQDFITAVQRITGCAGSGLHSGKLNNGALVAQLDSMSMEKIGVRILEELEKRKKKNEAPRISAEALSEAWNISIGLAAGQLRQSEMLERPPLCRDDTIEGLFFYKNIFV